MVPRISGSGFALLECSRHHYSMRLREAAPLEAFDVDGIRGLHMGRSDDSSSSADGESDGRSEPPRHGGKGGGGLRKGAWWEVDEVRAVAASVVGALVPWLLVVVANSPLLHPGANALYTGLLRAPDPLTCLPGHCWDGADKFGYPLCTSWDQVRGTVRGAKVPKYEKTCYKSMYINFEPTAAYALGIVMFFAIATSRMMERVARAWLEHDQRAFVVLAIALDMPAWYYSVKVTWVYVNEFMHSMAASQHFFTVTEFFVLATLAAHTRTSDVARPRLLTAAFGTSLFHILEIVHMEYANFFGGNYKQARNAVCFHVCVCT